MSNRFLLVMQSLGGAIGLSIAQTLFNNRLVELISVTAPNVDPAVLLVTGATEIRSVFAPEDVPAVLEAYISGLRWVWTFTISLGGTAFLLSFVDYKKAVPQKKVEDIETGPVAE